MSEEEAGKALRPLKAIRKKCLDCQANRYGQVRRCELTACSLWPYRMGHRPGIAPCASKPITVVHGSVSEGAGSCAGKEAVLGHPGGPEEGAGEKLFSEMTVEELTAEAIAELNVDDEEFWASEAARERAEHEKRLERGEGRRGLFRLDDAAALAGVAPADMLRATRSGELKAVRFAKAGRSRWRFARAELDSWKERRKVYGAGATSCGADGVRGRAGGVGAYNEETGNGAKKRGKVLPAGGHRESGRAGMETGARRAEAGKEKSGDNPGK